MGNPIILKTKVFVLGLYGLLFAGLAILAITGCEENSLEWLADDSSYEARLEEARINLDNGEYASARSLLLELKADFPSYQMVLQYLSNACAGIAGLDTFRFLEVIDQLLELDRGGKIDMVGLVLGGNEGILTGDAIDEKIGLLGQCAILELENITDPTNDQVVQLGLASLFHAALTIADIVIEDLSTDYIALTEDGLVSLYDLQNPPDFDGMDIAARLEGLSDDVIRIDASIDVILVMWDLDTAEKSDLSESFDTFLGKIDPNTDGEVVQQELENYLANLS
jgi:hypothetical protein